MSMNKPLFNIDQPNLQVAVNSYKPGNGFAWSKLFPLKYTKTFDLKGIEGKDGIPVSADKVAFNSKAPKKSRKKIGTWSGTLGKIAISRDKDEIEINEYQDAQIISQANPEDQALARELVNIVYDDVQFCNDGMDAKVEVDSMRIACMGKQVYNKTIDGDNVTTDIIDFNVPADNFKGVSTAWATFAGGTWTVNSGADGLKDIAEAQRAIQKKGLNKPRYAYMEQQAFDWLCEQTATQKRILPAAFVAGTITSEQINIANINTYMRSKGFPEIRIVDTYVTIEHKDGSFETIKPWQENLVTLSPTEQLGYTYYKPVPMVQSTEALQVQGSFYKMTRYSDVNPMREVTMSEAYVQPALINRASLVFINTAKSTWSDGDKS